MRTPLEIQERRRARHYAALETIAHSMDCNLAGWQLWVELRKIETRLERACLKYSNDGSYGQARWDADKERAKAKLALLFGGSIPAGIYINGDPRGHMLKLDSDSVRVPDGMQTDWGSDGILAPEDFK